MEITCPAGLFFCEACLMNKVLDEQSPDSRYCQGCYEVLVKEAETLTDKGFTNRPWWWPVMPEGEQGFEPHPLPDASASMDIIKEKVEEVSNHLPAIMSTPKTDAKLAESKRGPKAKELPENLIRRWAGKGMSPQAIAKRLADKHQVFVSYKTIKRRLQGVLL